MKKTKLEEIIEIITRSEDNARKSSLRVVDLLRSGREFLDHIEEQVNKFDVDTALRDSYEHFAAVMERVEKEWNDTSRTQNDQKSTKVKSAPVELKRLDLALALSNEGEFKKAINEIVEYLKANHK